MSKDNSALSVKIWSFVIELLSSSFANFKPSEISNNFIPAGSYPKILFSILHFSLKLITGFTEALIESVISKLKSLLFG